MSCLTLTGAGDLSSSSSSSSCLQDGAGAGQRRGVDRYHRLSLLQPEQICLQRLSPQRPAETQSQHVVYDPDIVGSLVKLLSRILRCSSSPEVLICSTIRNPDTYSGFKQQLGERGFVLSDMEQLLTQ
uniref:Protein-lysine N-methyltransferase EEF2KMT-like n=1 Tax=Seriola lalandi dorsalis TaxID=1841481 RepID=A0A3B4WX86_SERLL